ncbi:MAG: 30S ribosomal protein S5 [Candidatus Vogelbacteria bacterium]|nr:30S ribosomal protein S5 [Candidatus Vogelbacteria bacterium]
MDIPNQTTNKASGRGSRPAGRRGGNRGQMEKPRSEFDHKVISVRRVARVVAGGRRFSFSVVVVIGNRKGKVGVGLGKAGDTTLAIDKAMNAAKKALLTLPLTDVNSIPHQTEAKFGSSTVEIRPAPGKGLVAGSAVRTVLDLAGIRDITAKVHSRSKNKLNIARATIIALRALKV